jgi:hypothetical protein
MRNRTSKVRESSSTKEECAMSFRKAATAIVTVAMLGASTMAQAASVPAASRLSVAAASTKLAPGARVGAVRKGESKAAGSGVLIGLAVLAAGAGIYFAAKGGDSDSD